MRQPSSTASHSAISFHVLRCWRCARMIASGMARRGCETRRPPPFLAAAVSLFVSDSIAIILNQQWPTALIGSPQVSPIRWES